VRQELRQFVPFRMVGGIGFYRQCRHPYKDLAYPDSRVLFSSFWRRARQGLREMSWQDVCLVAIVCRKF
jgi:hypothetical protein